jgi:ribosomal protein S12 methylthiotransferase
VAEARALIADGVKELNLISQDSTYYGLDLRPNHSRAISSPEKFSAAARSLPASSTTICSLLRELNSLPGDFWIRLLYTHPAHWTDELIRTIAECRALRGHPAPAHPWKHARTDAARDLATIHR